MIMHTEQRQPLQVAGAVAPPHRSSAGVVDEPLATVTLSVATTAPLPAKPAALSNLALLRDTLLASLPEHYPQPSPPELHELFFASPAAAPRLLSQK